MRAKWQSRCPLCGSIILKGEVIDRVNPQRWGHLNCIIKQRQATRRSAARAYRERQRRRSEPPAPTHALAPKERANPSTGVDSAHPGH
jgi:hypothetical protein